MHNSSVDVFLQTFILTRNALGMLAFEIGF